MSAYPLCEKCVVDLHWYEPEEMFLSGLCRNCTGGWLLGSLGAFVHLFEAIDCEIMLGSGMKVVAHAFSLRRSCTVFLCTVIVKVCRKDGADVFALKKVVRFN